MNPTAAILLAAGGSRRLGRPKQLIRIGGESLLRRTARLTVDAGCNRVLAVLGFEAALLKLEIDGLAVETILNPDWEQGMASSLQAGLKALLTRLRDSPPAERTGETTSVLITVCDQPRLSVEVLRELIAVHHSSKADISACSYSKTLGVPAIFDPKVFPALLQLKGDQGAKRIMAQPQWKVSTLAFPDGGIDIDLPSDLQIMNDHY